MLRSIANNARPMTGSSDASRSARYREGGYLTPGTMQRIDRAVERRRG
jgi:hypothetical protein